MKVSLIVAMDRARGIGKNNDLMWHLPADMKFFKETTTGQIVLMGRKNYDSIPEKFRPLPNRLNVILTRNTNLEAPNCLVFHSVEAVLTWIESNKADERTFFVIGGGEIYARFLTAGCVTEMFITQVDDTFGADTFFPEFETSEWSCETVLQHPKDEKNQAAFEVLKYVKK